MIIYRTTPNDDKSLIYLEKLWQDNWIYCWPLGDKLVFRKEQKQSRTPKIAWDDFSDFYKLYPNKKGKENARVMWTRLTEKERELAHSGLIRYIAYWKQKEIEKQFLPHPATWLHQKRWEDDLSDNVILSKPIENLQKEMEEEKKHLAEKERIDRMIYNLRQDPIKWKEAYDKAKSQIPPTQLNLWPQIAESLILTRIKINLNYGKQN